MREKPIQTEIKREVSKYGRFAVREVWVIKGKDTLARRGQLVLYVSPAIASLSKRDPVIVVWDPMSLEQNNFRTLTSHIHAWLDNRRRLLQAKKDDLLELDREIELLVRLDEMATGDAVLGGNHPAARIGGVSEAQTLELLRRDADALRVELEEGWWEYQQVEQALRELEEQYPEFASHSPNV